MKHPVILKNLSFSPNLTDYDKTADSFSWKKLKKDAFANLKPFNAARIAIDLPSLNYKRNKVALYWENEIGEEFTFTFEQMAKLSNQVGNVLKNLNVQRSDRVFIFLSRLPELFFSFLGILKIGAIAGTLFAAFGPQALEDRLKNSGAKIIITSLELYPRLAKIITKLPDLEKIIIIDDWNRRNFMEERNLITKKLPEKTVPFYFLMQKASVNLKICDMKLDDEAFMLYTSGTTGKPKGVVHKHEVIIQQQKTAEFVLDIKDNDVYWCTADPGWVTGIAYEILGTWAQGSSTLVYNGRFDPAKWYSLIDEYRVNVWYTAPTAIRMLAAAGLELVKKYQLTSLRYLASVGEPLNPEAVSWGLKAFKLPFHDNFWQTETGGIVIANYPVLNIKPGSMGKPVPGIKAAIIDDQGKNVPFMKEGNLALKPGFPGLMKKIWLRPKKYQSYFKNGWYFTGDRAYLDKNGYFWFVGRADDVIKTSGERVGPFEVESALVAHPQIVEAGVIGKPDKLRGEIIKAFVTLKKGVVGSEGLKKEIQDFVKKHLAGHAYPREIEFMEKLPKTRSGKIMRRLLKAKELGLPLGDTSTLEEF